MSRSYLTLQGIVGKVKGTGTTQGSGWSAKNDNTGKYTVTLSSEFPRAPNVFLTPDTSREWNGYTVAGSVRDVTKSSFKVTIANLEGTLMDFPFYFVCM